MVASTAPCKGKVWESGDFSFGYPREFSREYKFNLQPRKTLTDSEQWRLNLIKVHGIDAALDYVLEHPEDFPDVVPDPLGLSVRPISHRSVKGLKGISSHGRRMVVNAALRMELEEGRSNLSFLTLTVPNYDSASISFINKNWAEIKRVFIQKLTRKLVEKGLPPRVVYVTEIQEERYREYGDVALHLHLVFKGKEYRQGWAYSPEEYRQMWKDVLLHFCPDTLGTIEWKACENVQQVKFSAGGYMGKYLSKGVKTCRKVISDEKQNELPSSWWGCSLSLRKAVLSRIVKLSQQHHELISKMMHSESSGLYFKYLHPVQIEVPQYGVITVGWVGRFTELGLAILIGAMPPPIA